MTSSASKFIQKSICFRLAAFPHIAMSVHLGFAHGLAEDGLAGEDDEEEDEPVAAAA